MDILGTQVGPYTIVSKIGDGGMAQVFKARVVGFGGFEKEVALKKILPNLASNEKFRRNFINEARICGQLHHHNIVEVYDFLQEGSDLYLAMEFIDGLNLEEVFNYHRRIEEPFTSEVILAIVYQIIDALEYAHNASDPMDKDKYLNVVHRDLKPSNILIDTDGVVKIVDFGVAKAAIKRYETQEMTAKGTASYMAPEQLLGDKPVTAVSDIFSIGTIFYELLTLERLFDGDHVFAILKQVTMMDIEAHLNEHITGADRRFLPVLKKALAREPELRFQSAEEMRRELSATHQSIKDISPRRLADHLRAIRNVTTDPEDAPTRFVTDDDLKALSPSSTSDEEGPTRVVAREDLDEYEEDEMETIVEGSAFADRSSRREDGENETINAEIDAATTVQGHLPDDEASLTAPARVRSRPRPNRRGGRTSVSSESSVNHRDALDPDEEPTLEATRGGEGTFSEPSGETRSSIPSGAPLGESLIGHDFPSSFDSVHQGGEGGGERAVGTQASSGALGRPAALSGSPKPRAGSSSEGDPASPSGAPSFGHPSFGHLQEQPRGVLLPVAVAVVAIVFIVLLLLF